MLIGIAGPKRSGKTTLAEGLCKVFSLEHHSFAGPIRAFVASILGYTLEELEVRKEEPVVWLDGKTPRQLMQTVGTEWGRATVHDELWVRSLLARVPAEGAVISDVRFPNEAEAILAAGGIVSNIVSQAGSPPYPWVDFIFYPMAAMSGQQVTWSTQQSDAINHLPSETKTNPSQQDAYNYLVIDVTGY